MFWNVAALFGGYVAAIFTWPKLRTLVAIEAKIGALREKVRVIAAQIKTVIGN